MKKLPQGFSSWISLYNHLIEHHPNLHKEKTVKIVGFNYLTYEMYEYKISTSILFKNCMLELHRTRPSENEVLNVIRCIYSTPGTKLHEFENTEKLLLSLTLKKY